MHACALLMSPATTCDLGKGKFSVLMWQLMPFPPPQMALIGHGMAQGQLLGVTVTHTHREREVKLLCANKCKLSPYLFFFSYLGALCATVRLHIVQRATCSQSGAQAASKQCQFELVC